MIKTLSRAQIEHIHEILYRPNTEGLDDGIEWTKFPGLFVQSARNSRSWIFRWNVPGKKRVMSLGTREAVTIQEAVDLAARYMEIVRAGGDPRAERDRLREEAGLPVRRAAELLGPETFYRVIVCGRVGAREIERLITKLQLDMQILGEDEGANRDERNEA